MKINIVLPFFIDQPGGGIKVMYQYANLLSKNNNDVVIYHSMNTKWIHKKTFSIKYWFQFVIQRFTNQVLLKRPSWFDLNTTINSYQIPKVTNHFIRDADIVFSTWWSTAFEISNLSLKKGARFNLIQDYEIHMTKQTDLVHQSYKLPITNIVVSNYLHSIVKNISKSKPNILPNAIDFKQFYVQMPIEERNTESVIMLYSDSVRKGTKYGIIALKKVIEKYPNLKVILFGVHKEIADVLPKNFTYYYLPENLLSLYNASSIFVSPSLHEGWGLPAMEAMACGCSCVCTNIEGHLDFMSDYETALFTQPANCNNIAEKIIELIENDNLRLQIAHSAVESIKKFNWSKSCSKLESIFVQNR